MAHLLVVHYVLLVVAGWLVVGMLGLVALRRTRVVAHGLFPVGAVFGLFLSGLGLTGVFAGPQEAVLPLGLPGLPFHLRLDGLSAYFLSVLGVVSTGVSAFSAGYFRKGEGTPPGLICFEYHVCLASMAVLLLADDAYCFMVAWETMTLSATFLVMTNHRIAEIRRAAWLYFLISHVGALALLLCFGLLQANTGDYTFASMRQQHLDMVWASIAFLLALFGFGTKAGIFPLHVWLPEAHPAAPSPVSALMSGFVLKAGLYGVLRTVFDLLHVQIAWWGVLMLMLGLFTALFGVVFSAIQTDMKRAARVFINRQHRPDVRQHGTGDPVSRVRHERAGGVVLDGAALPDRQPCHIQEPAFPRNGFGTACDGRTQSRAPGRPDPLHAVDRMGGSRGRAD
ncbi:formate hydrogenlyase subunit 3/multisubunit Na+/H+ antiporter MnhD subunit [Paraburkholderia sp. WC7.3g]